MADPAGLLNFGFIYFLISTRFQITLSNDFNDHVPYHFGDNVATFGTAKPVRYLLYEVNPGEGFNLRRDVYLRVANMVKMLNDDEPWALVLPPWGRNYHWRSNIEQSSVPWSAFFDLESLRRHVPVMEFSDFLKVSGESSVDEVIYLQRYAEGWTDGKWEERMDERDCMTTGQFQQNEAGEWQWPFWGFSDVKIGSFRCLSVQAQYKFMKPYLLKNTTGRSVFLVRAEELIHGSYSEWSPEWWTARRSMVFSKKLRKIGDDFRLKELASTDKKDKTVYEDDWREMKRDHGTAVGGPYLAVHLRRKDFVHSHAAQVPSIKNAAKQLQEILIRQNLNTVFVATDGKQKEYEELQGYLSEYKVVRYEPSWGELEELLDGGVAIIDQWICAHARYFIGSYVSTFSFRIQEEREILGFDPSTTFNRLCGDNEENCEQPTKWHIKF